MKLKPKRERTANRRTVDVEGFKALVAGKLELFYIFILSRFRKPRMESITNELQIVVNNTSDSPSPNKIG
jgi:hypothetical protein